MIERALNSGTIHAQWGNRRAAAWRVRGTAIVAGACLLWVSGCSVQDRKNGKAENVQLHTPIGSLDVRTDALHGPDVGLPAYPGAVETGNHGNDSGSADIHMSFGSWRLNVKAIEYHSADPEDKVIDFYKKAMGAYGDVLTCKDKTAVGEPSKTREGLSCANDHEYDVNLKTDSQKSGISVSSGMHGHVKLLAGSPDNQHIVEFSSTSSGTKFSVVLVQLPKKNSTD